MMSLIELEKTLMPAASIDGDCQKIMAALTELAAPLADSMDEVPTGALIFHHEGSGAPLMLWADMHSEGFMVYGHDELGYTRVQSVEANNIDLENAPLRTQDGVEAVLRMEEKYGDKTTAQTPMFLELGGNNRELQVGQSLVYDAEMHLLMNGKRVMAPFAGSHVPCAILLQVMAWVKAEALDRNIYFVFADGVERAGEAAYRVAPAAVLAVVPSEAEDAYQEIKTRAAVRLGRGAVLVQRDRYVPSNRALMQKLRGLGFDMQVQAKTRTNRGNWEVQYFAGAMPMAIVGLPMRHIGSPACIYDLSDAQQVTEIVCAFAKEGL